MPNTAKLIPRALTKLPGLAPPRWTLSELPLSAAPPPAELRRLRRETALITPDLEDPTADWPLAVTRLLRWIPLQRLAEQHPPLEQELQEARLRLSAEQALASPRLRPALAALLEALGPLEQRRRRWLREDAQGRPLLRIRAFTNGLREWIELDLSEAGLQLWPELAEAPETEPRPGEPWLLRVHLRPMRAAALLERLSPRSAPS